MAKVKVPDSSATVTVSVINTTSWLYCWPVSHMFNPPFPGLDTITVPSYSFLITHRDSDGKTRKLIFDLGIRKDWENLVPRTVKYFKEHGVRTETQKEVVDILTENGDKPESIEGIIWSHLHFDHTGNPARFPKSVKVIVGPSVKKRWMPGYPAVEDSFVNEVDTAGHEVLEITEDQFNIDIGGLGAFDYFGDGSFYILNAPGHMFGHLNGLARTTASPASFIYMGADSIHNGGEMRPSIPVPLPDLVNVNGLLPRPCPGEELLRIHPRHSATLPYLGLDVSVPSDLHAAEATISHMQEFDADERFLIVFAHDETLFDVLEYYPKTVNDWKQKDWKEVGRWKFLVNLQKIAREIGV